MTRPSVHVEPRNSLQFARHYVREFVYGANDGIITTFAVVAGVSGGGLSVNVVLICGVANLFADGLSMAMSNYLSIRSYEHVREAEELPEEEAYPVRHAVATFLSFVAAGTLPLLPYLLVSLPSNRFAWSVAITLLSLFGVGASRTVIANVPWWKGGVEMLGLGAGVAAVAYASGAFIASLVNGSAFG